MTSINDLTVSGDFCVISFDGIIEEFHNNTFEAFEGDTYYWYGGKWFDHKEGMVYTSPSKGEGGKKNWYRDNTRPSTGKKVKIELRYYRSTYAEPCKDDDSYGYSTFTIDGKLHPAKLYCANITDEEYLEDEQVHINKIAINPEAHLDCVYLQDYIIKVLIEMEKSDA